MEWFEKWFASPLYLELYSKRNEEEAKTLIDLIQRNIPLIPNKSKTLDICCGAGRHSIELARRGFSVTGFDLSRYLINVAKNSFKSEKEKTLNVSFLIKDMRKFNFKNKFDVAINIFTSFGYFEKDVDNFSVFRNIALSLRRNGYFIFDFLNSYNIKRNLVPLTISKHIDPKGKYFRLIQKRRIENKFLIKDIYINNEKEIPAFSEKIKLYLKDELKDAMIENGLQPLKEFGDYFGNSFKKFNSTRIIIIAKKV